MTEDQRVRLTAAVLELNAAMADIKVADGDKTRIYPHTHFNDDVGYSYVSVEITTGREIIGPRA